MKLIMAIINNDDASSVQSAFKKAQIQATKLASTGNFLSRGNTTLMVVTDDDKTDGVIEIISKYSKQRTEMMPSAMISAPGMYAAMPVEVNVGGATVFVLNVERFEKL